ncbi:MAG: hypothetical protein ACOYOP_00055 [Microthrixaceae bacterium]
MRHGSVIGSVAEVLLSLAGLWLVGAVLFSAVRTVVVPRGQRPVLTAAVFLSVRRSLDLPLRWASPARRERLLSQYAPVALVLLAGTWALLVILGFTPVYWALGDLSWLDALQVSGSSLTTLGFVSAEPSPARLVEVLEALIGLGLVGLLISFLPTIYSAFSRREVLVAQMASRAGEPPSVATFLIRQQSIRGLGDLADTWAEWEDWFSELEETHTSYPSLVYFRSGEGRSWLTSAGALLDSAAMLHSAVDVPRLPSTALAIRAGFLCLREVADQFLVPYDPDPSPGDPISVTREEFDACLEELDAAGVPLVADRDAAWRAWAGWRVNYDGPLLGLCSVVEPPPAPWSSDRVAPTRRRVLRMLWRIHRSVPR